jgi:hypothetical protein
MLLIVILNAVLAVGIVAVIAALHTKAIIADHLHHGGKRVSLRAWGERTVRPARATPEYWPARRPAAAAPHRQVAAARG